MEDYKRRLLSFMVQSNVLKFGDFTLRVAANLLSS